MLDRPMEPRFAEENVRCQTPRPDAQLRQIKDEELKQSTRAAGARGMRKRSRAAADDRENADDATAPARKKPRRSAGEQNTTALQLDYVPSAAIGATEGPRRSNRIRILEISRNNTPVVMRRSKRLREAGGRSTDTASRVLAASATAKPQGISKGGRRTTIHRSKAARLVVGNKVDGRCSVDPRLGADLSTLRRRM